MCLLAAAWLPKLGIRRRKAVSISVSTLVLTWYLLLITTTSGTAISKRYDIVSDSVARCNVEAVKPCYPTGIKYHCVSLEILNYPAASQWISVLSGSPPHSWRITGLIRERIKTQWNWIFYLIKNKLCFFPNMEKIAFPFFLQKIGWEMRFELADEGLWTTL